MHHKDSNQWLEGPCEYHGALPKFRKKSMFWAMCDVSDAARLDDGSGDFAADYQKLKRHAGVCVCASALSQLVY